MTVYIYDKKTRKMQVKGSQKRPARCDCWPMASYAAGVSPDEIPEMRKIDTAAGIKTDYNSDGEPILTGPQHRKNYLELHGMYDRNAGFSDPTPKNR